MTDIFLENDGTTWSVALNAAGDDFLLSHDQGRQAEVGQRTVWHFAVWRGELWYAPSAGIPYLEAVFGVQPIPGVAALLTFEAGEVDGVAEIESADYELEQTTRALTISIEQRATDSDDLSRVTILVAA